MHMSYWDVLSLPTDVYRVLVEMLNESPSQGTEIE